MFPRKRIKSLCKNNFWRCMISDSGAQFLEYAMLAGLIGLATSAVVMSLGDELLNLFKALADKF